jgi:hypothetical protein
VATNVRTCGPSLASEKPVFLTGLGHIPLEASRGEAMSEVSLNLKALRDLKAMIKQLSCLADKIVVDDEESLVFLENIEKICDSILSQIDKLVRDFEMHTKEVTSAYDQSLEDMSRKLQEIFEICVEKLATYHGGDYNLARKLIYEVAEKSELSIENQRLLKKIDRDYRLTLADAFIRFFTTQPSFVEANSSQILLNGEKIRAVHKNARKAKQYLQETLRLLPNVYLKSRISTLESTMKFLDEILDVAETPAHRPENELVNLMIVVVVDSFLEGGYSMNKAYQLVGELFANHGLLEEGEYLGDKVRHRYRRYRSYKREEENNGG